MNDRTTDLLNQIIPPADYQHRNGFSNERLIDGLTKTEKAEVEKALIASLEKTNDYLIGETLAYLASAASLPVLNKRLTSCISPMDKILWASYINRIKSNAEMKHIAFEAFQNIHDEYRLIEAFHVLVSFRDQKINDRIKSYQHDSRYLIAYNARTALGQETKELVDIRHAKNKKHWWKFW